jgi:Tfp pilus assembly protein PilF
MTAIDNFEKMLAAGRDSALLRFSLGGEYLKMGDPVLAAEHLAHAVELDPAYSAAWKLYGKALVAADKPVEARTVYERGIEVAEQGADKQAAKEMRVFLRRLNKQDANGQR